MGLKLTMTAEQYAAAMRALLPPGPAWPRDAEAPLVKVLTAWAEEFARIDGRANDLLRENEPGNAMELNPEWELLVGLLEQWFPDFYQYNIPADRSLGESRAAIVALLTYDRERAQTDAYYIALAAVLGYEITITHPAPSRCGVMQAGDELAPAETVFSWVVNVTVQLSNVPEAGVMQAGDELGAWRPTYLEFVLNRGKQSHTVVTFNYVNP